MTAEETWLGSTIDGRYRIEERIARGGMSTVYRARDERLNRDVAVKVLFPHMAEDHKVVQRFEQEAKNSALISHPNVVQVLDQGQTRETAYMVMEYVPGVTLRTLLKRGPMTPRLALAYAESVLAGLAAAHRAGLVHRDIKPENVLVASDGQIKLADFGLARAATHHSGTSTLMGTVAYIAPELLSGEGSDERGDIYALGILIYEMLTGVQPYTGDSPVRVAFQHVNSTVPAPSAYVPGMPEPLDELVREATRGDALSRPKNADALMELLLEVKARLTDAQLDFAGAIEKHERLHGRAAEDPAPATAVMPATPAPDTTDEHDDAATEQGEETVTLHEEFPTADDADPWDEDVTEALGAAKAAPRPRAPEPRTASLAVDERQTVAEVPQVPLGRLSVQDEETSPQEVAPSRLRGDPGSASKKARQRPTVELAGPTPTKSWIAVAVLVIVLAVVMLIAYQLGISSSIIPSLGGGGEQPDP
ncbi:protein kinase domain-containing protein [Nesterenkonia alba]|uniref:protein kinase domain-containing protein n=1 Tax=Nesterenkonia alba TaxID=515814 RepID=UPI0003B39F22|nr:protein kinase [Nesterenkonia alba]